MGIMRTFTLIAFCWPILISAQKPFELERYTASYYQNQIQKVPSPYTPETAVEVWWLAYKAQRASDPGDYFPAINAVRSNAKTIIESSQEHVDLLLAFDFIESRGSKSACEMLINSNSVTAYILPYQFMAAFLLGNDKAERIALLEMESQGLISSVMKSFGANAMKSAKANEICITSGMQDLIAVRIAQLIDGLNNRAKVYNIFASKCTAYQGKSIDSILSGKESMWISPAIPEEMLRKYADRLHMIGLGYSLSSSALVENNTIRFTLAAEKMDWSKKINEALTSSDKGLLQALKPLAQAMEQQGFQKEADSLDSFIKYYANR